MNFSKLLVLLKSNLKLQIYKHETAKQKIINSPAKFPMNFFFCPETVFKNIPVPRNSVATVFSWKSTRFHDKKTLG